MGASTEISSVALGRRLAQLREAAGLKQAELARQVTWSPAVLSRVEAGDRELNAEELGVTQANVDEMKSSEDPDIQTLLGVIGDNGTKLGVDNAWAYNVVKQVGNYEDIYMRHFGPDTPVALERDQNTLWTQGGLLYGFPMQ